MKVFTHLITAIELFSITARLREGDMYSALKIAAACLNKALNPTSTEKKGFFGATPVPRVMAVHEKDEYDAAVSELQEWIDSHGHPAPLMKAVEVKKSELNPVPPGTTAKSGELFTQSSTVTGASKPSAPKPAQVVTPAGAIDPQQIVVLITLILSLIQSWRNKSGK